MSLFEPAWSQVKRHQKFNGDRSTGFGLSIRQLADAGKIPKDFYADQHGVDRLDGDIAVDMGDEEAQAHYRAVWNQNPYRLWPQSLANKVFDLAIDMGAERAHKMVQRVLCAFGHQIRVDGHLATDSQTAIRLCLGRDLEAGLIAALRCEQAGFYRALVASVPALRSNLGGWLKRAAA